MVLGGEGLRGWRSWIREIDERLLDEASLKNRILRYLLIEFLSTIQAGLSPPRS